MSSGVFLKEPSMELREQYLHFFEEWKDSGEQYIPWVTGVEPYDFTAMIKYLQDNADAVNIKEGWVPSSTFWLVTAESKVVGAVNIRHALTQKLLESGGHIGYGIVPSERGQGYARELLKQALVKAGGLGIEQALVVCDARNTASECTIRGNGGRQDEDFVEPDGNFIRRFWMETGSGQ